MSDVRLVGLAIKDEDDKKGEQAVKEVMEEQIKKEGERSRGYDQDGKSDGRDWKWDRKETRICYACRTRGHVWKDCGEYRKDGMIGEEGGHM